MSLRSRKLLGRVVALMCCILVVAFITILLNGTLIFKSDSSPQAVVEKLFLGLSVGQTKLQRIDSELVWASRLSADQLTSLSQYQASQINLESGCVTSKEYCVLIASTQLSGINLQYSKTEPPQLLSGLPWIGGFVNPVNGAVYDLLGRQYLFQGQVDSLSVVDLE